MKLKNVICILLLSACSTVENSEPIIDLVTSTQIVATVMPTEIIESIPTLIPPVLFTSGDTRFPRKYTFQVALGDLDDDGDLDAVFANFRNNHSAVWINLGDGTFENTGQELSTLGHSIAIGDLDGDNDLDIFIAAVSFGINGVEYSTNSKVYLNDGLGVFVENVLTIEDEERNAITVQLHDIDLDGDLDAFVDYGLDPDVIYENDGEGNFKDSGLYYPILSWVGDLDGDGDVDIFAKEQGVGYVSYLNDGIGNFEEIWRVEAENVIRGDIMLFDSDNDGDLDAIIANGDHDNQYPPIMFINNGFGNFEITNAGLAGMRLLDYVTPVDINQDGWQDLLITNVFFDNEFWLNNGDGTFYKASINHFPEIARGDVTGRASFGDIDGDGDLDLFLSSWQGSPTLWINNLPNTVE